MHLNNLITEKVSSLSVILVSASEQHDQENTRYAYGMKCHQILAITDGKGIVEHNGTTYELKKGTAFFCKENTQVKYLNYGGLQSIYITARGEGIDKLCNFYSADNFIYFENVNVNKLKSEIFAIIQECQNSNKQGKISAMTYATFSSFFEDNLTSNLSTLQKAVNYIETNFAQKIKLEDIAQECSVSVSKLCHDFKEKHNKTIFEYIIDTRLNYARNYLLFTPDSRIKDACIASGFEDNSYFCKAYKNKFGITPSQDKENNSI